MKTFMSKRERGSTLLMSLIFLTLTAIISTSLLKAGVSEFKMAGNAQFQEEAFQTTEGVLDAVVSAYQTNLPITGGVGYVMCANGSSQAGCDRFNVTVPNSVSSVPAGVSLHYRAERLGPLFAPLPFRLSESEASSAGSFIAAIFEINANYNGRDVGLGYQDVFKGVAIRLAASQQ